MVNHVILVGNLGKDPELRYTPSGQAVATFSLATSESYKDRDGNSQTKTEWHNIVVWRQLAEICGQYLHKGKQVYIEGRLQTRKYEDKNGATRYTTEIVADQMKMLGGRDDQESRQSDRGSARSGYEQGQGQGQTGSYGGPHGTQAGYENQYGGYQNGGQGNSDAPPYTDDDIPY